MLATCRLTVWSLSLSVRDCGVTQSLGDKSQNLAFAAAERLKPSVPHGSRLRLEALLGRQSEQAKSTIPPPGRSYRETIPRLTEDALVAIDAWINRQREDISRSEAIRRLLNQALAASPKPTRKPMADRVRE